MCAVAFSVHRYIGYTISSYLTVKTHKRSVLMCRLARQQEADPLCSVFHLLPQGRSSGAFGEYNRSLHSRKLP